MQEFWILPKELSNIHFAVLWNNNNNKGDEISGKLKFFTWIINILTVMSTWESPPPPPPVFCAWTFSLLTDLCLVYNFQQWACSFVCHLKQVISDGFPVILVTRNLYFFNRLCSNDLTIHLRLFMKVKCRLIKNLYFHNVKGKYCSSSVFQFIIFRSFV